MGVNVGLNIQATMIRLSITNLQLRLSTIAN